jgi:hypothetical protein
MQREARRCIGPTSTPVFAIRDLSWFVLGMCAVIFVVVGWLLAYSVMRFR